MRQPGMLDAAAVTSGHVDTKGVKQIAWVGGCEYIVAVQQLQCLQLNANADLVAVDAIDQVHARHDHRSAVAAVRGTEFGIRDHGERHEREIAGKHLSQLVQYILTARAGMMTVLSSWHAHTSLINRLQELQIRCAVNHLHGITALGLQQQGLQHSASIKQPGLTGAVYNAFPGTIQP